MVSKGQITVNGKPLPEHIEEERGERLGHEAQVEFNGDIREKAKWAPRYVRKPMFIRSAKTGRMRCLSPREIRKEYGMTVTVNEKIIECVRANGPMTSREIAEKLKFGIPEVSTIVYRINQAIPAWFQRNLETISNHGEKPPYSYRIGVNIPGQGSDITRAVYREYLAHRPKQSGNPNKSPKGQVNVSPRPILVDISIPPTPIEIPIEIKITISVEVKK